MQQDDISDEVSRHWARILFPEESRGRTLSKMIADNFGTTTETVHAVGLILIIALLVNLNKN